MLPPPEETSIPCKRNRVVPCQTPRQISETPEELAAQVLAGRETVDEP